MPDTPLPLIYLSDSRTLYLGRGHLPLREIHTATACLMLCLEGRVRFRTQPGQAWVTARSLLIPAGSRITIDNRHAVLASCHLDASRPEYQLQRYYMAAAHQGIYCDHRQEARLIEGLLQLREEEPAFAELQPRLEQLLYPAGRLSKQPQLDPRIAQVVRRIRASAHKNVPVGLMAAEVGLSESGLIKLFRKQMGVPIRKHRLWYRVVNFVLYVVAGKPTAVAARLAGFADASHLSKCYSSLMGVPVSIALSRRMAIQCLTDEAALCRAEASEPVSHRSRPQPQMATQKRAG